MKLETAMGAWGYGIRQDDFVCDVIGAFEDFLKAGKNVTAASKAAKEEFADEIKDSDDGPLFWIALAEMQWTYGELQAKVLNRVKKDLESGRSLDPWLDDSRGLKQRKAVIEKFIAILTVTNPKPKKIPKVVVRSPKFQAGDCLSILHPKKQYGAAIVLATDISNPEYGQNLICTLDYLSPKKPTMEDFNRRNWLVLTHHSWDGRMNLAWYGHVGFRAEKDRLEVIGQISVRDSDPTESNLHSGWNLIGEQIILQRNWNSDRP